LKKEQEKLPEDEEKKQSGEVSRRDFLVGTGTVVVGGAIGAGLLSSCTGDKDKTVTATVEKTKTVTTTLGEGATATVTATTTVGDGPTVTETRTTRLREQVNGWNLAGARRNFCVISGPSVDEIVRSIQKLGKYSGLGHYTIMKNIPMPKSRL
jgi:hypothetical protein